MAASAYFETVQKIYIAFYQRPADPAGLKYWAEQIDKAGGNPNAVITAFGTSPEAQELYGDIDADTIGGVIDAVYQAAFGRAAEQEEIDYWAEGFNAGTITASSMALAVVLGAQNDDLATIDNKLEVANEFTAQVDGRPLTDAGFGVGPFAATYEGNDDAVAARDVLVNVTADPGTILSAEDITTAIQDTIADEGDPIVTPEVPTFTLAAGAASVAEGSDVEFTLTASVASDTDRTFQVVITGDDKNGTVGITKADDADFVDAVQIVVLPAGETEVTFSLNPEANDGAEGFQGFKVTLLDEGFNAVAASGTVVITDVTTDTEAPVVTAQTAPATYAENSAAGTVVATVAATDDTAVTGYTLTGNDAGFFAIDATGKITLTEAGAAAGAASNDYETGANSFTLGVVAVDEAGNQSAAVNYVLNVTNVDDDAPALIGSSAAGSTVRLNFSEALKAAVIANPSAVFTVSQGSTSFSINSAAISGNVVTLTLATALAAGDTFVSYNGTVLEDAAGNKTAAIASTKVTSTDIVAPTLSSSNPADDSTTFGAASNLVLTFSEAVVAGSGQIKIVNTADATDTRTIDIKDAAQVTISGSTVTINPTADLKAGGTYAVNIDATAVLDAAGNAYAGIANNTTLNFTAAAATPPVVPGQTFTLTTAIDTIPGLLGSKGTSNTDGEDTIVGDNATMSSTDAIDGGASVDTLNYTDSSTTGAVANPVVKNVEIINIRNVNGTAAVAAVTETTTVTFSALAPGATVIIDGVTITGTAGTGDTAAQAQAKFVAAAGTLSTTTLDSQPTTTSVVLKATAAGNVTDLVNTGTGTANVSIVQGVAQANSTGIATAFTASNFAGATNFNSNLSTNGVTFDGMVAGQAVGAIGNSAVTLGALTGNYAGSVSAATLNLTATQTSGATLAGAGAVTIGGAGVTTATVNSLGTAANSIASLTFGSAAVTTLNIDATAGLSIGAAGAITGFSSTQESTIKVTGAGAVRVNTLNNNLDVYNASAATGAQTLTLGAATQKVTTGSGADIITTGSIALTTGSVDAGVGAAVDRLVVTATADVDAAAEAALYSNFEEIQVGNNTGAATVDLSLFAAKNTVTALRFANKTGAVQADNVTATQAANVAIIGDVTAAVASTAGTGITINVVGAGNGGQIDTVKAALTTTTARNAVQNIDLASTPIALAGVEKLELTGTGTSKAASGAITLNTDGARSLDLIKLTTVGDNNVITIDSDHSAVNLVVDASASSGTTTIDASAYAVATGATIKGSTSNDDITGSAKVDVLSGSGGRDFFKANDASVSTAVDKITDFGLVTSVIADTSLVSTKANLQAVGQTLGGANVDLIDFGTQAAARATVVTTPLDVAAVSGDATLDIKATIDGRGLITLSGTGKAAIDTAVEALEVLRALNSVDGGVGVLVVGDKTFVMLEDNANAAITDDFVIELTGVAATGLAIGTGTAAVGEVFVI